MKRVQIKMEDEIYNTMVFKAKALGITNSSLVRNLILEQTVVSADTHKDYTRAIGLMSNLTNNINQIAHNLNIANKSGYLKDYDYDNLINMLTIIENNSENFVKEKY
jgi:hypothetical protein